MNSRKKKLLKANPNAKCVKCGSTQDLCVCNIRNDDGNLTGNIILMCKDHVNLKNLTKTTIPIKNGCKLDCKNCEYKNKCSFNGKIKQRIKKWVISTNKRTQYINKRYQYKIKHLEYNDVEKVLRECLSNGCKCLYCGKEMIFPTVSKNNEYNLSLDHIKSMADGGTNEINNLLLCHSKCNKHKELIKDGLNGLNHDK